VGRKALACTLVLALGIATPTPGRAQINEIHATLLRFLREPIGMDSAAIARAFRGEAFVKVMDVAERRDVAIFGLTAIAVTKATYDARIRDVARWLQGPTRTRFGVFSDPATAADVATVVVSQRDADDMKSCKPGDCVVKLPAVEMQRIRAQMNWSARDLAEQLSRYARTRLVEYVSDYRTRGDSAMALYDDRSGSTVRSRDAFAALLAASPYVYQHVPSLERYFALYPREKLPHATEVIYWAEDDMPRLRPTLSVTHQVIYEPPELPGATFIAAKQIYANHYFEAVVDLTYAVDRRVVDGQEGIYLMTLRRCRFDNLPSGGLLNIRGRAINALRDQMQAALRRQKATLEAR
jgi:hypothetical protein